MLLILKPVKHKYNPKVEFRSKFWFQALANLNNILITTNQNNKFGEHNYTATNSTNINWYYNILLLLY